MRNEAFAPTINRDKKVLITGHTGFKGTWLTLLLERIGFEVQGIALEPETDALYSRLNRRGKIQEKFVDIRDRDELSLALQEFKPAYVFHLAAQPLVLESYKNPIATFETNVMGTAHLLQSLYELDSTEGIVVATTDKVYRNVNQRRRFKEDDPLEGKDPYSASKVGTESVVSAWQQIGKTSGGPALCVVRAGNVIGGGDFAVDRLIPDLVRSLQSKQAVSLRNPKSTRPWQHALDPLFGYFLSLNSILTHNHYNAFNFGPSEPSLSVKNVVDIARKVFPELQTSLMEQVKIDLESNFLELDSSKANIELQWNPAWSQENAVTDTMLWWKKVLSDSNEIEDAMNQDLTKRLNF